MVKGSVTIFQASLKGNVTSQIIKLARHGRSYVAYSRQRLQGLAIVPSL